MAFDPTGQALYRALSQRQNPYKDRSQSEVYGDGWDDEENPAGGTTPPTQPAPPPTTPPPTSPPVSSDWPLPSSPPTSPGPYQTQPIPLPKYDEPPTGGQKAMPWEIAADQSSWRLPGAPHLIESQMPMPSLGPQGGKIYEHQLGSTGNISAPTAAPTAAPAATLPTSYQSPYQTALSGALGQSSAGADTQPTEPVSTGSTTGAATSTSAPSTNYLAQNKANISAKLSGLTPRSMIEPPGMNLKSRIGSGATAGAVGGAMAGAGLFSAPGAAIGAGLGAAAGLVTGLLNRHASSAGSDFTVQEASALVADAFETLFGRTATPQDIEAIIKGQGWKPGDRWVGKAGLTSVITQLSNEPEATSWAGQQAELQELGIRDPADIAAYMKLSNPERVELMNAIRAQQGAESADTEPTDPGPTDTTPGGPDPVGKGPDDPASSRNAPRIVTRGGQTFLTEHGNERLLQPNEIADAQKYVADFWAKYPSGFQPGVGAQTNEDYEQTAKPSTYQGQLEGFDAAKLGDPAHNTPKYVFARIAAQYDVKDLAQRQAMLAALKADPSGYFKNATLTGSKGDVLTIGGALDPKFDGFSQFDIIRAAGEGGKAWVWQPLGGTEGGSGSNTSTTGLEPEESSNAGYQGSNTTYNSSMLGSNLVNDLLSKSLGGQINFGAPSGDTYSKQMLDYLMRQLALGGALR